uniref:AtnCHH2 preproprotein n=1 Tax=Athanas nitescens TaxID=1129407 RepID=A0A2Z1U4Z3_9EUCA|nr:AtnCHH2 preproprotein [Athanas nitescens]
MGHNKILSATVLLALMALNHLSETRSIDEVEKVSALGKNSLANSASTGAALREGLTYRRSVHGPPCKGINDHRIRKKLEKVCRDCHNLYRKASVAIECKRGCFVSDVFLMCVADLLLPVKEYDSLARTLRDI